FPDSVILNSNSSSKSWGSPPCQIRKVLFSNYLSGVICPIKLPFPMRQNWLSPSQPSKDSPLKRETKPSSAGGRSAISEFLGPYVLSLQENPNTSSITIMCFHKWVP